MNYFDVIKDGRKQNTEPLFGTEDECESFVKVVYDDECFLTLADESHHAINIGELKVDVGTCRNNAKFLFDFEQDEDSLDMIVYDQEGFQTKEVDIEHFMNIGNFNELATCQDCFGEGFTEELTSCFKPASECCGGCTKPVECKCTEITYKTK